MIVINLNYMDNTAPANKKYFVIVNTPKSCISKPINIDLTVKVAEHLLFFVFPIMIPVNVEACKLIV
jgi:hypothetical protein